MSDNNVLHLQSSTQIIQLSGVKILTDPWLTQGEYYGNWMHNPVFPSSGFASLEYDYIYVSHIHPDHASAETFKLLPKKKPVLIAKFDSPFLKRKIESFGFQVIELDHGRAVNLDHDVYFTIFLADNCDPEVCGRFFGCKTGDSSQMSPNIDSLCLIENADFKILNTNDCPFELAKSVILNNSKLLSVDLLLVGYAGAGPFPQCFKMSEAEMEFHCEAKKLKFLTFAKQYIEMVEPRFYAPFAGTYILGGRFSELNKYRGVPTVREALEWLTLNLITDIPSRPLEFSQGRCFDLEEKTYSVVSWLAEAEYEPVEAQQKIWPDFGNACVSSLLESSYKRFKRVASEIDLKSEVVIEMVTNKTSFYFSKDYAPQFGTAHLCENSSILKLELDHELLIALLHGPRFAHWNNAEVGSHITFERVNCEFDRSLNHALYFFYS